MLKQDNFKFEPIAINEAAPGGACVLRTFDDIDTFVASQIHQGHRIAPHWGAVRQHLQAAHLARGVPRSTRPCATPSPSKDGSKV
jgi:hypothetical protein